MSESLITKIEKLEGENKMLKGELERIKKELEGANNSGEEFAHKRADAKAENKKLKEEKEKLENGNMMLETALIAIKHNKKPKYSIIYWKEKYQILDSTDDRFTSLLKDGSTKEYYCFDTLEEAEKCMDRIMFAEQVVVKEYY